MCRTEPETPPPGDDRDDDPDPAEDEEGNRQIPLEPFARGGPARGGEGDGRRRVRFGRLEGD
jgi:hypothetical protein